MQLFNVEEFHFDPCVVQMCKLDETLILSHCLQILKLVLVEWAHLTFLMQLPKLQANERNEFFIQWNCSCFSSWFVIQSIPFSTTTLSCFNWIGLLSSEKAPSTLERFACRTGNRLKKEKNASSQAMGQFVSYSKCMIFVLYSVAAKVKALFVPILGTDISNYFYRFFLQNTEGQLRKLFKKWIFPSSTQ